MKQYIETSTMARENDAAAINLYQIPSLVLMEHAAMACADEIEKQTDKEQTVFIACGPGNNGGDGIAIGRLLLQKGYNVHLFVPNEDKLSKDEKIQFVISQKLQIPFTCDFDKAKEFIQTADFLVDALFGSGLSRPITGNYKDLVEKMNQSGKKIYSVDIPSGLDGTTGEVLGCAIQASETFALDCIKTGELIGKGLELCGKRKTFNIGIPAILHEQNHSMLRLTKSIASKALGKRSDFSHKGTFGKCLMIGGSSRMFGAEAMAASSCFSSGIGTLTIFAPETIHDILAIKMNTAMIYQGKADAEGFFDMEAVAQLENIMSSFNIIGIGNGMGKSAATTAMVQTVLQSGIPCVVDADGISGIAENKSLLNREAPVIITPHVKEFADLMKIDLKQVLKDPFGSAKLFTDAYPKAVLILKSDITLVCQGINVLVLDYPNSALAKGGSGDLLCGITTALLGQLKDPFKAAAASVMIHSLAARSNMDPACFTSDDFIHNLDNAFKTLRKEQEN